MCLADGDIGDVVDAVEEGGNPTWGIHAVGFHVVGFAPVPDGAVVGDEKGFGHPGGDADDFASAQRGEIDGDGILVECVFAGAEVAALVFAPCPEGAVLFQGEGV